MATWVYKCEECAITLAVEVADGQEAPEAAVCTQCGNASAKKLFELPKPSCGCSGGCC